MKLEKDQRSVRIWNVVSDHLKSLLLCMHGDRDTLHTAFDHIPACTTLGKQKKKKDKRFLPDMLVDKIRAPKIRRRPLVKKLFYFCIISLTNYFMRNI